jgi:hypothetical protein
MRMNRNWLDVIVNFIFEPKGGGYMKRIIYTISTMLLILAVSLVVVGCSGGPRESGMVVSNPTTTINKDGTTSVQVDMLTHGQKMTIVTAATTSVGAVSANLVKGNLVDFKVIVADKKYVVYVPGDEAKTFNVILSKGNSADAQFDTMKYGAELSPDHGVPGNMVAAGWVYAKTRNTITVGDGRVVTEDMSGRPLPHPIKRYEETYKVAHDVAVYNVNTTDYSLSAASDFASIPVTADYKYSTTSRQAAYFVFDRNYKEAERAEVSAIYYFTPQSTTDGHPQWEVPTNSYLLNAKGTVPASESAKYAGQTYVSITDSKPQQTPYNNSTEPFEIVKDTFYFVGDREVAIYLFNAKESDRLIMLDAAWPNCGYMYWKNIEAMGYDPRKITDIMLTHGHADHNGTANELVHMIENAGGKVKVWGSGWDTFGLTQDGMGNSWNIAGALGTSARENELRALTVGNAYEFDNWYDFGNVQILVTPTPGHTIGTTSFKFKVKSPRNHNKWVTFGYQGGYGFNGLYPISNRNGALRLDFQAGLAWLQQQWNDIDFVSPQHTNQYPIVEVYQALKAYNNDPANKHHQLTMLDALTSTMPDSPISTTEFANFCEKRYDVITYAKTDLPAASGGGGYTRSAIENVGPFKPGRENGLTNQLVTLQDAGKIIQGFNGFQNVNPKIPLLANGIQIVTDAYVNDPTGYYVQFFMNVLDDGAYKGYLPVNYVQGTYTFTGGPVESIRPIAGTPEIIRTVRLNSLADAQAILATVQQGGTYSANLNKASEILVPADVTKTFTPAP